jgi:hypothetical protein
MDEGKLSRAERKQRSIDRLKTVLAGSAPSALISASLKEPAELPTEENTGQTVKGGKRRDPRDNTKLLKVLIPNAVLGGKDVWIDVNPKSGGIFLDRGELSILSAMPSPVDKLRDAVKTATGHPLATASR